jgi:hypothetical protein
VDYKEVGQAMSGQTDLCAICRLFIEYDYTSNTWKDLRGRSNYGSHNHVDWLTWRQENMTGIDMIKESLKLR